MILVKSSRLIVTLLLFIITVIILISSIIYAIKPLTTCTGYFFLAIFMFCFGFWWILASFAVGADFALADFCISPNPDYFIQRQISLEYKEESQYFLYCHGCSNPFKNYLTELDNNFEEINETVVNFVEFTSQFQQSYPDLYSNALKLRLYIIGVFPMTEHIILNDLSCNETNRLYATAINDGCEGGLRNFTIETGCAVLLALVFFILTTSQCFVACRLTAFYRKKRKVKIRFEEALKFTPASYYAELQSSNTVAAGRTPKFHQDDARVGYRRTLLASVNEDEQTHILPTAAESTSEYQQHQNYDIQLSEYSQPPPALESYYDDTIDGNDAYVEMREGTNKVRVRTGSSMEENLHYFFPDIAHSISPEGIRESMLSANSQL